MSERYVVETGSGSDGVAYVHRNHEVLDMERQAGSRLVCRASGPDARLIAAALNATNIPVAIREREAT